MVSHPHIRIPYRRQHRDYTCGPVVVQMILAHFGMRVPRRVLVSEMKTHPLTGTGHAHIVRALRRRGIVVHAHIGWTLSELRDALDRGEPVIVNYRERESNDGHYAIAVGYRGGRLLLQDPWAGPEFSIPMTEFSRRWYGFDKERARRWAAAVRK